MNDQELGDVLFSRLLWPVGLVKERTASAIARLIAADEDVAERFANWVVARQLESEAAYGLLVLWRAAPSLDKSLLRRVQESMFAPSLLSDLIWSELGVAPAADEVRSYHSGTPPIDFVPSGRFLDLKDKLLPPFHAHTAERLDRDLLFPFQRQWAFEADMLAQRMGVAIDNAGANYSRVERGRYYAVFSTSASELLRSAYLRALATLQSAGRIDPTEAAWLAAEVSPVDLTLWSVPIGHRPDWWPSVQPASGLEPEIDTSAAHVWNCVETLWHDRATVFGDNAVAFAQGWVSSGADKYELVIVGLFQRASGPNAPGAGEVGSWTEQIALTPLSGQSPLKLEGEITRGPVKESIADWELMPAIVKVRSGGGHSWQSWRMLDRALAVPHPLLGLTAAPSVAASQDGLVALREDGGAIGVWQDWADGVDGSKTVGLPPPSGSVLLVDRETAEAAADLIGGVFMWTCKLTVYRQEHGDGDYERTTFYRMFGASKLVR